jgi:Ca2+-binding EF-hand superfamily protein
MRHENRRQNAWFLVLFGVLSAFAQSFAASKTADLLQLLDSDHDGTVDLGETKAAASALFDQLDRDHDGTLSGRELKGRLSAKELAADDHDHDGTLTKGEYLATVEKRFNAANRDRLDAKELGSRPGRALKRLVLRIAGWAVMLGLRASITSAASPMRVPVDRGENPEQPLPHCDADRGFSRRAVRSLKSSSEAR